ncbi:peptide deformylase [Mycoplasmopsis agassizii]|uniref:Peptide deformylase n=1 Tax=Mycoplasmopsis agassizii TaxID=33922 RepID=A0A269TIM0_9BACT|nr:peptide deformylase [Mycoplasmopsis agassizii]PAK21294.1 peptide deformylase [Mycoplasmopsis agassizii]
MKLVNIIELPDKRLRQISKEVTWPLNEANNKLAERMIRHIDNSQTEGTKYRPGVGVAAVQYGILKRMFYVNVPNDSDPKNPYFRDVLINPVVLEKSIDLQALHTGEGCLSVNEKHPNQEGLIRRSRKIKVQAYSYFMNGLYDFEVEGYVAIVFQHELDHLDGKLFIDHIDKKRLWNDEGVELL